MPYVQVFCGDGTMLISELSVKIMDEFVKMKKALKLKLKPNVTSKAKTERLMLRIFDENIYAWLDPSRPVREVVPNGGNVVAFLKRIINETQNLPPMLPRNPPLMMMRTTLPALKRKVRPMRNAKKTTRMARTQTQTRKRKRTMANPENALLFAHLKLEK